MLFVQFDYKIKTPPSLFSVSHFFSNHVVVLVGSIFSADFDFSCNRIGSGGDVEVILNLRSHKVC
jgi:hypothetical protein